MKTDTHADADQAERIVAAMSDDDKLRITALMQRRDDALRAAATGLAEMVAYKRRDLNAVRSTACARRQRPD